MLKYALKRIFVFIPTLIIISLMAFIISVTAPGDPVERLLRAADSEGGSSEQSSAVEEQRQALRAELGLDRPIFYFSIATAAQPDTLYRISDKEQRKSMRKLVNRNGDWSTVSDYYLSLQAARDAHRQIVSDTIVEQSAYEEIVERVDSNGVVTMDTVTRYKLDKNQVQDAINNSNITFVGLLQEDEEKVIQSKFDSLDALYARTPYLKPAAEAFVDVKDKYSAYTQNTKRIRTLLPSVKWYGSFNQYHKWLFGDRPWSMSRSNVMKDEGVLSDSTSFTFSAADEGWYEVLIRLDDKKVFGYPAAERMLKVATNGAGRSYTADQLIERSGKLGNEYLEKVKFPAGEEVELTLYHQSQKENSIPVSVEVNQVKGYNPEKFSGGALRGDFGRSYHDGQPISRKIGDRVKWSLILAFTGLFLAYILSIPIGIYAAYRRNSTFDQGSAVILFILYSLPSFFVATWLLYQFANPDRLIWFPEAGIAEPSRWDPEASFWAKMMHRMPFFVLPTLTYAYGSLAFLSRIMRVGMVEVFSQDYIRTARAKGLSERSVVMKHALRNSLIPIITVFANIFPLAIGGSIVIEMIFSYPGMGFEIYQAVINQDYPMIITVFTILGFLTMLGYLISDILYGVVDPRISYK
jgi:peptide/nickel transport system permease protein